MGRANVSESKTTHLLVEAGPDRGQTITIPDGGARLGRATGNDILLNDPSISRFQCRFYFKDDRDLAVADLASTNDTLVNDKAFQDVQLFVGDRVVVGETTLKVVGDTRVATGPAPGDDAAEEEEEEEEEGAGDDPPFSPRAGIKLD